MVEGILCVFKTGARLARFAQGMSQPQHLLAALATLGKRGVWLNTGGVFFLNPTSAASFDWSESFLDGSFAPAKKGASASADPKRGKGTKWMVVVDGAGVPLGVQLGRPAPRGGKGSRKHFRPNLRAAKARPTADTSVAGHRRSRLRQRSLAVEIAATGHSPDLSHTAAGGANLPSTTDEVCAFTQPLENERTSLGWATSAVCSSAMIIILKSTRPFSTSPASS